MLEWKCTFNFDEGAVVDDKSRHVYDFLKRFEGEEFRNPKDFQDNLGSWSNYLGRMALDLVDELRRSAPMYNVHTNQIYYVDKHSIHYMGKLIRL